jgi:hypothetical protein
MTPKEIRQTSNEELSQRKSQDIDKPYPDKVWVWTNVGIYNFQKRGCKSKGSCTLKIHLQFCVLCILVVLLTTITERSEAIKVPTKSGLR